MTKKYVILAKHKDGYVGQAERSFKMVWSKTDVRIQCNKYRHHTTDAVWFARLQDSVKRLQKQYPKSDVFIARVGSNACPVKVDLNTNLPKCNHRFIKK